MDADKTTVGAAFGRPGKLQTINKEGERNMAANRKKYMVIAGLVVLLVLTGYLNYRLNLADVDEGEPAEEVMAPMGEPLPAPPISEEPVAVEPAMQIEVGIEPSIEASSMSSAGFFATFRTDRDRTRTKEIEVLDGIIASTNTSSEQIADAQAQKLSIVDSMEKEMTVENMIKAKGFSDAAVTIHKGSVNAVIDKPALSEAEVAQVLDICVRETGEDVGNIKIMPRE